MSHAPRQGTILMVLPETTAADGRIRSLAWMLDAVFDVNLHQNLVNKREISHKYVEKIFESCEKIIVNTMKGLDLISFSLPKQRLGMANKNAVPVTAILHGTHEIRIKTVQAMFARMEGLWTMPCTKHFLIQLQ